MLPITPLFNVAVIEPSFSSPSNAIETVQRAYHTVFGRDIPAEGENYLLLLIQVCSTPGVPDSIVEELRKVLPSLPDLIWQNVAPVVGLNPSQGEEQLSGTRKRIQLLYFPDEFVDELLDTARWRKYWSDRGEYVQLGSSAVKYILNKLGFSDGHILGASASRFELRIQRNAAVFMLESERWLDRTQVLVQAVAEVTCLAASNSRLGYSFPIHIVITDLYETTFYTYDPSVKKLYMRRHFRVEDFGCERDIGGDPTEVRESLLLRMIVVLTRDIFSLLMEAYHDYVKAKIPSCPDMEDTKACERALELIEEAKTLLSNRRGTQEEGMSGFKKLRTSILVLPWGCMRFTEEEMRVQNEEALRYMI
ncbi:uncharacterized protein EV420DRAFT_1139890 [Desarmillaria tabescens]|uniref:Uncharacterized protein n=1 Tax=Armillaria tabescens TaxID=1929756 RepID=A0AA39TKZ3_ARMTA|nr:uncharacterized protein EV420DRAFT_1139890 [Desarmillaria tabescens]KAK0462822.1 hypothetical protein EV420DRAFT_1139890 [Desarmillaria tabescens]